MMRPIEIELLLCCARTHPDAHTANRIEELAQGVLDWDGLVQAALRHRVMPLLYRSLHQTCPEAVPGRTLQRLRTLFLKNSRWNLVSTAALLKLLDLLDANGVAAVPFKGPVLAQSVFGDLALRQYCDLDILIPRDALYKAYRSLRSEAYCSGIALNARRMNAYAQTEYSLELSRPRSPVIVELHWEAVGKYIGYPLGMDHFADRLETVSISGKPVRQFSSEDTLVHLCIHGSKDCWRNLDSISCVAALIRARPDLDWTQVLSGAREIHCRRMLYLGLRLAHRLLGAPLPPWIQAEIDTDPAVARLAGEIGDGLWAPGLPSGSMRISSGFGRFHFAVRDRIQDKLRHLASLLFLPSRQDWRHFHLPENCTWLYYPLRPIRLAGAAGAALVSVCMPRSGRQHSDGTADSASAQ